MGLHMTLRILTLLDFTECQKIPFRKVPKKQKCDEPLYILGGKKKKKKASKEMPVS